jgi:hypothetical protein
MLTSLPDNIRTYYANPRSGDFPIWPDLDETTVFDPTKYTVSIAQSLTPTGVGINRNFPDSIRADDGTPVVKRRFPLSRIALFANPAANAADIKKYFGLERVVAGSPAGTSAGSLNDGLSSFAHLTRLAIVNLAPPVRPKLVHFWRQTRS